MYVYIYMHKNIYICIYILNIYICIYILYIYAIDVLKCDTVHWDCQQGREPLQALLKCDLLGGQTLIAKHALSQILWIGCNACRVRITSCLITTLLYLYLYATSKRVYIVWTHTILSVISKFMCTWMKMMKAWKGGIMWNQCILGFCICLWILMDRLTLRLSFLTSTCLA